MDFIEDSIEIKATPERIYSFFENWTKNYKIWHPDHGEAKWIKGNLSEVDSILYIEEYLHGELHKMKFRLTYVDPPNKFDYKILFPMSLIIPKGSFIIDKKDDTKSTFRAIMYFRLGKILKKVTRKKYEELRKHMKEEGVNLKKILEETS
ncbi:MAG: SRPBCC family protein [Asgard group archaeon]|nr:SRPBCC family protein [Asgard group archaeon]